MSGLCGWLGSTAAAGDPAGVLDAMAQGLPCASAGPALGEAVPQAGLTSRATTGAGGFGSDAGVYAAYEGYPRWRDRDLAALAASRGVPHALVEGFRKYGGDLPTRVEGPIAFAVLDPSSGSGIVAIDRVGVYGMCFAGPPGGGLAFGTTTDAVRAYPGVSSTLSTQALYEFLFFIDRIPAPYTVYEEQSKLLPGQCIIVENGTFEVRRYWRPTFDPDRAASRAELCEGLRTELDRAVGRCLEGEDDAQVGSFLSGGLDSSTVSGLLAKNHPGRARAFTISFADPRYDESPYARIAAERFGLDHVVYQVDPQEVLDSFVEIATIYDEPFANSSAVPSLACARRAREAGIAVLLAGDGGDELFAGNTRYLKDQVFQRYRRLPGFLRCGLIEPVALRLSPESDIGLLRKTARYTRLGMLSIPARAFHDNIYAANPVGTVFDPDLARTLDLNRPMRLAEDIFAEPEHGTDLQRYLYLDLRITIADSDLRKIGRMCDLAGIRVRFPMLDDAVVAFACQVPSDMLCAGGVLRSFYKQAFAGFLPRQIIDKPKHGFGLPFQEFLGQYGPLRDFAVDTLAQLRTRGIFADAFLDRHIAEVRKGPDGSFDAAWDLLVLEHWLASRNL